LAEVLGLHPEAEHDLLELKVQDLAELANVVGACGRGTGCGRLVLLQILDCFFELLIVLLLDLIYFLLHHLHLLLVELHGFINFTLFLGCKGLVCLRCC